MISKMIPVKLVYGHVNFAKIDTISFYIIYLYFITLITSYLVDKNIIPYNIYRYILYSVTTIVLALFILKMSTILNVLFKKAPEEFNITRLFVTVLSSLFTFSLLYTCMFHIDQSSLVMHKFKTNPFLLNPKEGGSITRVDIEQLSKTDIMLETFFYSVMLFFDRGQLQISPKSFIAEIITSIHISTAFIISGYLLARILASTDLTKDIQKISVST
jgi:hypothetical protein